LERETKSKEWAEDTAAPLSGKTNNTQELETRSFLARAGHELLVRARRYGSQARHQRGPALMGKEQRTGLGVRLTTRANPGSTKTGVRNKRAAGAPDRRSGQKSKMAAGNQSREGNRN
jgi:hypothetical protein